MSLNYLDMLKRYRQRYNERDVLKQIYQKITTEISSLKSAKTCLSLGTGYGEYDIEFIQMCLPNLEKLIVVEKNPDCIKELKKNLKTAFGDRIEVEIYATNFTNFMEIYEVERLKFFDFCFNSWLNPEKGLLIYDLYSQTNHLSPMIEQLGPNLKQLQHCGDLKNDIQTLGHHFLMEIPYYLDFDLQIYDDDIRGMIFSITGVSFTEEAIMTAIKKVFPSGIGKCIIEFCIVCKCI